MKSKTYITDLEGLRTKEAEELGVIACVQDGANLTEVGICKIIDTKTVRVHFHKNWQATLPDLNMELLAMNQELPGGEKLLLGFLLQLKAKNDRVN